MSIAGQDLGHDSGPRDPEYDWGDGPAAYEPGNAPRQPGDRTPPQDNAAEQSVLGSMLISKDEIANVTETLRGVDFYRPAHEKIHDAIIDLYGRSEPADPVTVAAELQRRGELSNIGGAPYLHTLSANVPIAANAAYYAEIVREKAILRRLVEAGTKIVQIGYAGEGAVDDVVDQAQAEVYKITDRRTAEDYAPLSDIMNPVLDEIEAIGNREAGLYGVPTGFADLDDLTNGLHSGQMIIVAARPAMGKALALDTPLATPDGWTTMGEVAVGDRLYDAHGRPTRVVAATEVMVDRPCYEVRFSDGSSIVADAEHQWLTETRAARKSKWAADNHYNRARHQRVHPSVVTTEQIASTVRLGVEQRANHAVLNAAPLEGGVQDLLIDPYVLGAWLGDGHSAGNRITCETDEIPMYIEGAGYRVQTQGEMLYSIRLHEDDALEATRGICVDCGGTCSGARRALPVTPSTRSRHSSADCACWVTSTSRPLTSGRASRRVVPCSPVSWTPTARSCAGSAAASSRSPMSGLRRTCTSSSSASVTAVAAGPSASKDAAKPPRRATSSTSRPRTTCSGWSASTSCTRRSVRRARPASAGATSRA